MKIAGIVAEYNPYHNGHFYLTKQLRKQGATHIAAVMSGHLVQRGEVSLFSKWARAEAALKNGVDSVSYTHLDVYKRQIAVCDMVKAKKRGTKDINLS